MTNRWRKAPLSYRALVETVATTARTISVAAALLTAALVGAPVYAGIVFDPHSTVRALGMGNAFTVLAADDSCLVYNPAGLARVTGINWKIFGIRAGGLSLDKYEALTDLMESSTFVSTIQNNYGENFWATAGVDSAFYMPMLAVGAYQHIDASFLFTNPQATTIQTHFLNDFVYTAGFGLPLGPFFELGANLRYIRRAGTNLDLGPKDLSELNVDALTSRISQWGRGYGADLGANFIIPAGITKLMFGGVWKNVGTTRFKSEMDSEIPIDKNDINLGMALQFNLPLVTVTPAIDFKHVTNSDLQLPRKLNMGIEIDLPLIDIRGGFSEGYYTAGVGVDLGLFQVQAATYGVELGTYPGQLEERRYVAEFSMELGLGNFSASPNAAGASSGGSKGGSNSQSLWGGKRLKQRR